MRARNKAAPTVAPAITLTAAVSEIINYYRHFYGS